MDYIESVSSNRFAVFDTKTSEVTEFKRVIKVSNEKFFQIYSSVMCSLFDKLRSMASTKIFMYCLKYAVEYNDVGNVVYTDTNFQKVVLDNTGIEKSNMYRAIKELCSVGLLKKLNPGCYLINPEAAFCGKASVRKKLIVETINNELDNK